MHEIRKLLKSLNEAKNHFIPLLYDERIVISLEIPHNTKVWDSITFDALITNKK